MMSTLFKKHTIGMWVRIDPLLVKSHQIGDLIKMRCWPAVIELLRYDKNPLRSKALQFRGRPIGLVRIIVAPEQE